MNAERRKRLDTEWMDMIRRQAASGQSIKRWCAENGVVEKTFYLRRSSLIDRGLLDASGDPEKEVDPSQAEQAAGFVEITTSQRQKEQQTTALMPLPPAIAPGSDIIIRYSGYQIEVGSHFEEQVLFRVLEVMRLAE